MKKNAPEKTIILEAETYEEALCGIDAKADVIQLDKFSLTEFKRVADYAAARDRPPLISAAGGVNKDNAADYAAAGADLIVTSAPYYAKPADVKVVVLKELHGGGLYPAITGVGIEPP
jgi:molybdenum transport protein